MVALSMPQIRPCMASWGFVSRRPAASAMDGSKPRFARQRQQREAAESFSLALPTRTAAGRLTRAKFQNPEHWACLLLERSAFSDGVERRSSRAGLQLQ